MGKLYNRDINRDNINHPICFSCKYSRLPASEVNYQEGWIGCVVNQLLNIDSSTCYSNIIHEGMCLGWVYSKLPLIYKGDTIPILAGILTNDCLLVRGVKKCLIAINE